MKRKNKKRIEHSVQDPSGIGVPMSSIKNNSRYTLYIICRNVGILIYMIVEMEKQIK